MTGPLFPRTVTGPQPKPAKGSTLLARADDTATRLKHAREVAAQVKRRDGRCRWPEAHTCRGGPLEAAHLVNKSQGGETSPENVVTLCPWMHRRGPESIHGQQLKIETETPAGANGPLSFWRQDGNLDALGRPTYYCVARERSLGIVERD
jgi:hypothetical protein